MCEVLFRGNLPFILSFSARGGEGARRTVEGFSDRFMAPMHAQKRKEGNPRSRRRESAHLFAFEAKD